MIKPRKPYRGQGVIEYVVIFAVVAAVSIGLFFSVPGIFSVYVTNATGKMTK